MITDALTATPEPIGTSLLEQLSNIEVQSMSAATARKILELSFSPSHRQRFEALSEKARQGSLMRSEGEEIDEFLRLADLLAILQSKARQALKRSDLSSSRSHGRTE